jgi:hypothetical protein
MEKKYECKGVTKSIKATSRTSIKKGNTYYTLEYCEERVIPETEDVNIEKERKDLWDTVNTEVDNQITDIDALYE